MGITMYYASLNAESIAIASHEAADVPVRFAKLDRKAVTVIHNLEAADTRPDVYGLLISAKFNTTPINTGSDVWIVCKEILLRVFYVGNPSVIGARALVKSRIPKDLLAVGVPARLVKRFKFFK